MTNEQTKRMQLCVQMVQNRLHAIETGQGPNTDGLTSRREQVNWEWCWLLAQLIPALPIEMQAEVQDCYETRECVWSEAYHREYYNHKKTSSPSLATLS